MIVATTCTRLLAVGHMAHMCKTLTLYTGNANRNARIEKEFVSVLFRKKEFFPHVVSYEINCLPSPGHGS